MNEMINVTVWSENFQEKNDDAVKKAYPNGIYGCIAGFLGMNKEFNVKATTFDMPEQGLSDEIIDTTDVLIWWAHCLHNDIKEEIVNKIVTRVQAGMGIIFLHSAHFSKPFIKLMGTSCSLKWYENENVHERLWTINPSHPIATDVPEQFLIENEEMYGEFFDIPNPDENIFLGWFSTGHLFRSGSIWNRGRGKVFYFQPGHETFPVYSNPIIQTIIKNAVVYVAPKNPLSYPVCPNVKSLED